MLTEEQRWVCDANALFNAFLFQGQIIIKWWCILTFYAAALIDWTRVDFLQMLAFVEICVSFLFSLFLTSPHRRCRVRVASLNHLCQSCRTWQKIILRKEWKCHLSPCWLNPHRRGKIRHIFPVSSWENKLYFDEISAHFKHLFPPQE